MKQQTQEVIIYSILQKKLVIHNFKMVSFCSKRKIKKKVKKKLYLNVLRSKEYDQNHRENAYTGNCKFFPLVKQRNNTSDFIALSSVELQ